MVGLHMECIWRDISAYFPSNTGMYFDTDVFRHRLIQIPGVQCKTLVEQWSPIGDGDIVRPEERGVHGLRTGSAA